MALREHKHGYCHDNGFAAASFSESSTNHQPFGALEVNLHIAVQRHRWQTQMRRA